MEAMSGRQDVTLGGFLAAFYPAEDEEIRLRLFKPRGAPVTKDNCALPFRTTRAMLASDGELQARLRQANRTRGVYFVVNAGGDTDETIARLNAWFAEDDSRPLDEQHRKLDAAPLAPSIRVETHKSVHAYWLVAGGCGVEDWRDIQHRLIAYFGSDPKIKNPARVMRLPFFNHVRYDPQDGTLSYKRVEIAAFFPERCYTLEQMRAAFPSADSQATDTHTLPDNDSGPASFSSWDDLNAELKRRIMHAGKQNRKGIFEARGLCHNGTGQTALCFNPATGAVWCNSGCDRASINRAFGLPEQPNVNGQNGAAKSPPRFSLTKLDDLLAEPPEEVAFIWERTLPRGGFSICGAKPKVGKSTLARNLAVAVTRGADFFGRPTNQGEVVYLCLEEKRAEVAEHFRRMGAHGCGIHIHTGRAPNDALTALETVIDELRPALVIVDPLARFVRVRDFNDYAEVARGLEPLIDLARNTGCHILGVHHCGKGERDGGDALLGSTALFGAVDALLIMKRREGARTLQTVQRYGEDMPETVAYLDAQTGIVTAGGDMQTLQTEERKAAVLECMGDERLTEADIRERVGGNQTLTARAIRALFENGDLERSGAGRRGDPYHYRKAAKVGEPPAESSILDSTDIENRENLENRAMAEAGSNSDWLANVTESNWMMGEPDEVRECAAIMEIDGRVPSPEAERLARQYFAPVPR